MQIIFEKVVIRNFQSYGDTPTVFYLNRSPTTLITGINGAGKCLRRNTEINVEMFDELMTVTVEEIKDFYENFPSCIGKIKVETVNGYKPIEYASITAKDSEVIYVKLENGCYLYCSPLHLLKHNDEWVHVENLKIDDLLDVREGVSKIIEITKMPFTEDLYDLQVEGKEFIANGIVTHNSTIIEAFHYALTGKSYRGSNKEELINTINQRDCYVELHFEVNGLKYIIYRGMKPNIFRIELVGGKTIEEDASLKDMQKYLETNNHSIHCRNGSNPACILDFLGF